jgi:hypothetical protein
MKKVIRLTERDLMKLVKKVIKESEKETELDSDFYDNELNDEKVINSVKWYLKDVEGVNLRGDETDDELINMYTNLRYNRK